MALTIIHKTVQFIDKSFLISSADKVSFFTSSVAKFFNLDSLVFNNDLTLLYDS